MKIYAIKDKTTNKYVSLASKHRKFYCRKQNAQNAINNTWRNCRQYYEVEELECTPTNNVSYDTGNIRLGNFVRYDCYYVKDKNGIYIDTNRNYENTPTTQIEWAVAINENNEHTELNFEGDGIMKPLYRLKHGNGTGYVIDRRILPITEYLYSDTTSNWNGSEVRGIFRNYSELVDCVKVAYGMGKTRYVPISALY